MPASATEPIHATQPPPPPAPKPETTPSDAATPDAKWRALRLAKEGEGDRVPDPEAPAKPAPTKAEVDAALKKAQGDGYQPMESKDSGPKVADVKDISSPDKYGSGVLAYTTADGKKHVVAEDRNPDAYRQAAHAQQVWQDIKQYQAEGYKLAGRSQPVPKPDDIATVGSSTEHRDGVITYHTRDGGRFVVSKDMAPDVYDRVSQMTKIQDVQQTGDALVKAKKDGYEGVASPDFNPAVKDIKSVGAPEKYGKDLINFTMTDGRKYVVQKDINPGAYQQATRAWEHFTAKDKAVADGYTKQLTGDDDVPALDNLKSVTDPDQYGHGILGYTTSSGEKKWVSEYYAPKTYTELSEKRQVIEDAAAAKEKGYRKLPGDQWSPKYQHIDSAEYVGTSGEVIGYKTIDGAYPGEMGKKHYVTKEDAPKAFDQLKSYLGANEKPEVAKGISGELKGKREMIERGDQVPGADDITRWSKPDDKKDAIEFSTKRDQNYFVSKTVNPEGYREVESIVARKELVKELEKKGYKEVEKDDTYDPAKVKGVAVHEQEKVTAFTTPDGDKKYVTNDHNPGLYQKLGREDAEEKEKKADAVRKDNGQEAGDPNNVLNAKTSVARDDKGSGKGDDKGKENYTVGELAAKALVDDYRKKLDNGDLSEDDPRAKLVRAVDAGSAAKNGTIFVNGARQTKVELTGPQIDGLFKPGKIENTLRQVLQIKAIQQDYSKHLNDAVEKIPDRKALAEKLADNMRSDGYAKTLYDLQEKGLGEQAKATFNRDVWSLALLDQKAAKSVGQQVLLKQVGLAADDLVGHPEKIDKKTSELVTQDTLVLVTKGIRSVATGPLSRYADAADAIDKFRESKKNTEALGHTINELTQGNEGERALLRGDIDVNSEQGRRSLERAMEGADVAEPEKGAIRKFVSDAQKYGVWGTIGFGTATVSFGYKLSKGQGDTAEERWSIARDALTMAGFFNPVAKTVARFMDGSGSGKYREKWGIDQKLPEIWDKKSFWPSGSNGASAESPASRHELPSPASSGSGGGNSDAGRHSDVSAHSGPLHDIPVLGRSHSDPYDVDYLPSPASSDGSQADPHAWAFDDGVPDHPPANSGPLHDVPILGRSHSDPHDIDYLPSPTSSDGSQADPHAWEFDRDSPRNTGPGRDDPFPKLGDANPRDTDSRLRSWQPDLTMISEIADSGAGSVSGGSAAMDEVTHMAAAAGEELSPSRAAKLGKSALKVVGAVTDLAAVADAYFGVKGAVDGAKAGDKLSAAANGFNAVSGAAATVAVGVDVAVLIAGATLPEIAVAVGAGAWLFSAVTGGVGFVLGAFASGVAAHKKQVAWDNAEAESSKEFNAWDHDGFLADDWKDKKHYIEEVVTTANHSRKKKQFEHDFPDDVPVWSAQPDVYRDFLRHSEQWDWTS